MPAGFADGVDNGSAYQNLLVVAKSGATFTTITAAVNSIFDASPSNRYLIYVAPGVYTEQVTMKQYVDIQGSGELTTKITFTGSALANTGTLIGAYNTELRFLTVENSGGGSTYAIALYNCGAAPRADPHHGQRNGRSTRLRDLQQRILPGNDKYHRQRFRNGRKLGVYKRASPRPLRRTSRSRPQGFNAYGILYNGTSLWIKEGTVGASGGTSNYGISNVASSGVYHCEVQGSHISGDTSRILGDGHVITLVGGSQLKGGPALVVVVTLRCGRRVRRVLLVLCRHDCP